LSQIGQAALTSPSDKALVGENQNTPMNKPPDLPASLITSINSRDTCQKVTGSKRESLLHGTTHQAARDKYKSTMIQTAP